MTWLDTPLDSRPQLIMGKLLPLLLTLSHLNSHDTAYEPSLDQAGHLTGPNSKLVNVRAPCFSQGLFLKARRSQETLRYVDSFAKDLHNELVARNLTDIVDVIFVSDHGMTDTSHPELVYVDDILGEEGVQFIDHEDGTSSSPQVCLIGCSPIVQGGQARAFGSPANATPRNTSKFCSTPLHGIPRSLMSIRLGLCPRDITSQTTTALLLFMWSRTSAMPSRRMKRETMESQKGLVHKLGSVWNC